MFCEATLNHQPHQLTARMLCFGRPLSVGNKAGAIVAFFCSAASMFYFAVFLAMATLLVGKIATPAGPQFDGTRSGFSCAQVEMSTRLIRQSRLIIIFLGRQAHLQPALVESLNGMLPARPPLTHLQLTHHLPLCGCRRKLLITAAAHSDTHVRRPGIRSHGERCRGDGVMKARRYAGET